jgi:carboxymethylenebutenolidase
MADIAPLTVVEPAGTARGAVLVLQEAFGVNQHIRDICQRLADAGYVAVAPHLFHRTGDPELGYDDFSKVAPHFAAITPEGVTSDIGVALQHLAARGFAAAQIGVVGFCFGGTMTVITATTDGVGAAVTFYGGGVTKPRLGFPALVEVAPDLRVPWLGLYGDLDAGISVDDVEQMRAAAASSGQPTEVVRYADADHGFNCDRRGSYHEPSATDAWARMLAWFETYLAPATVDTVTTGKET